MTAQEIAKEIAVLMQTRTAIPSMTVRELVALDAVRIVRSGKKARRQIKKRLSGRLM
ncbi:hypothetical protein ACEQPO_28780 [Bacillus sp. SL00103]